MPTIDSPDHPVFVDAEEARRDSLARYALLDTPSEEVYDRFTRFAASIFGAPIALVSLLDEQRQWFKSCIGLAVRETPRSIAFCDVAIRHQGVLLVPDAAADPRFVDNPLVTGEPGIRFYAGAPLIGREGHALGTLCVIDTRPRHDVTAEQLHQLRELAAAVCLQMESRRALRELEESREALRNRESLLTRIYDTVQTGIAITDSDGRVREANGYFWRLVTQPKGRILGRSLNELMLDPVDLPPREGGERQVECQLMTGTGERVDVAIAIRQLELASGERVQVVAVSDLRWQKVEERMMRMRAEILQRITAQAPLPDVLADVCRMLEAQVPNCRVLITRMGAGALSPVAGPSLFGSDAGESASDIVLQVGASLSASAADAGTTLVSENLVVESRWPDSRGLLLARGIRAAMAAPVRLADGSVAGTVSVYWNEIGPIGDRVRLIVEEYAELVALAMAHAGTVERLHFRAYHDSLTGLANRELFFDRVSQAIVRAQRNGGVVGVLMLDLDDFKLINDSLGHDVGDKLLLEAARRLRNCVRGSDTVARLGGDEFAVALETTRDREITLVASKILRSMSGPAEVAGHRLRITPSIGVAVYPRDGHDAGQLLKAADTAMYEVKRSGKRGLRVYDAALARAATDAFMLMQDLGEALQNGQLTAHLQPRVDLESGIVPGIEAYVRWEHPRQGVLSAGSFLAVAEQAGLMPRLDHFVLDRALPRLAAARKRNPALRLHWNLSVASLQAGDFAERLGARLAAFGLPPDALQLELMESQLHRSLQRNVDILADIRRRLPGLRVGLDDFGITHGAITTLPRLELNSLTVDRSFTARLSGSNRRAATVSRTLITTLVNLARELETDLVVEGVENRTQLRELLRLGCTIMQGTLFADPAPELPLDLDTLGLRAQSLLPKRS